MMLRTAASLWRPIDRWGRVPVWAIRRARRPGLTILMYHCVGAGTSLEFDLPIGLLSRQLAFLRRRYRIVSLDDLVTMAPADPSRLPTEDLLVLTFDDAHEGLYTALLPLIMRHRIPATVYLQTEHVELQQALDWGGYRTVVEARRPRPLAWWQVRALLDSGLITIGAHTHSHADLSQASPSLIAREIELSNDLFRRRLGIRPRHFAYPFGRTSPDADRVVASAYDTAVVVGSAKNTFGGINLHALRRVPVARSDGFWFFRVKLLTLRAAPFHRPP